MLYMAVWASRVPKHCLAAGLGLQQLVRFAGAHSAILPRAAQSKPHKTLQWRVRRIRAAVPAATLSACSAWRTADTGACATDHFTP